MNANFQNDDAVLLREVDRVLAERRAAGLEGLVGGLAAVVINTAPGDLLPAAEEMLGTTALAFEAALENPLAADGAPCLLLRDGRGPDFLLKSRPQGENPFAPYNRGEKTGPDPSARLETFVFACEDVARYAAIQQARGVVFQTPSPVVTDAFAFIQTVPSAHTGNALGFIEWKGRAGDYAHGRSRPLPLAPGAKPDRPWLARIRGLDHVATRVPARHRDAAIAEFLALTNYRFDFAVYVESLNSITNVARLGADEYAQVFTSGIAPLSEVSPAAAGPTERFIANYGVRPHHLAFGVCGIEAVVAGLAEDGVRFLSELVGSREEGLRQIFSAMWPQTLLVHEYIERYDGFDGFFTKSNVTRLTRATQKQ
uniref:VOC domain-containing protein n=1 Tax=Desulfovibrio sp. U5L TaxID=596152 RepID=I2Q280_9BACT